MLQQTCIALWWSELPSPTTQWSSSQPAQMSPCLNTNLGVVVACVTAETRREMVCVEGKGEEPARPLEQGRQQVLEGKGGGQLQSALGVIHRNHIPLHPYVFMIKNPSDSSVFLSCRPTSQITDNLQFRSICSRPPVPPIQAALHMGYMVGIILQKLTRQNSSAYA